MWIFPCGSGEGVWGESELLEVQPFRDRNLVNGLAIVICEVIKEESSSPTLNHVSEGFETVPSLVAFPVEVNFNGLSHAIFAVIFD